VCRIKAKDHASAKKDIKDRSQQWRKHQAEKGKSFASTSKKDDNDDDEDFYFDNEDFMTSFMDLFTTAQKNKKNRRKCGDNDDTSDYDANYLQPLKM
jgi:lysylphosphatidylglycerol synthetase-like protein (DUF2156 family)